MNEEDPLIGAVVNERYRIERLLGLGGMGRVYLAEHLLVGKRVALKTLIPSLAQQIDIVKRFRNEARAASMIGHENIVDVLDMGQLKDGSLYMVMELLDGEELMDLFQAHGPLPIGRLVRIIRQVCGALSAAHAAGIVHRDLKPQNIFMVKRSDGSDFAKVLDFGISKFRADPDDKGMTATGVTVGTPAYMSPEQAQGLSTVDHRTDIYAIGAILYLLISGELPVDGEGYAQMIIHVLMKKPADITDCRADLPPALAQVVMRCLEKQPEHRFETMAELDAALAPFADHDAPLAPVTPPKTERGQATIGLPDQAQSAASEASPAPTAPPGVEMPAAHVPAAHVPAAQAPTPGTAPAVPVQRPMGLIAGGALVALALVAGVVGFVVSGDDDPPTPPAPPVATAPDPEPAPAQPAEVRVRVRVMPSEATVTIGGVTFPNPMDAQQPRSLTPAVLRAEAEGYQPLERTVIFDEDMNLDLNLAPVARAVEPEPTPATVRRRGGGRASASASSPSDSTPSEQPPADDGMRREF